MEKTPKDETATKEKGEAAEPNAASKPKAKTKAQGKEQKKPAEVTPIGRGAVRLAVHAYQNHSVIVPAKDADSVLASKYWSNNAANIRPGDEIRVLADDFSWRQTLLVTYKSGDVVGVVRIDGHEISTDIDIPESEDDRYKVMPATTGSGFVLRDVETGALIGGPFPTRSKAERQKEDHIRAMAL